MTPFISIRSSYANESGICEGTVSLRVDCVRAYVRSREHTRLRALDKAIFYAVLSYVYVILGETRLQ